MSGRILLFKGFSQYDVVRNFIDDLAMAFQALGKNTLVVDLASKEHTPQVIQNAFSVDCAFACGFNLNGSDLGFGQEGVKFFRDVGIPYVGMLVDHPLYHYSKFRLINEAGMPDSFLITCVDKEQLGVMEYCGRVGFSTFLPHAGSYADGGDGYKDMGDRSKDIVFCGSYGTPKITWAESPVKPILDDIAEYMLSVGNIQVHDALQQVLKMRNYVLRPDFFQRVLYLVVHVDSYVRSVWRGKLINELANAGINLHLYGNGWEQLPCAKKVNIHKAVGFREALTLMSDAKIILNLANFFSHGSHERVFSAMLNGAVALTDVNDYWRDKFEENKEIVTYSALQMDELPEKITTLLADLPRLNAIAHAGNKKAEQFHTWKARAEEIIGHVRMMEGIRSIKV